jgi:platelet-activating factor acetylhydrolase IB subunit beta/gamma
MFVKFATVLTLAAIVYSNNLRADEVVKPSPTEPSAQEWKEYPGAWMKWHESLVNQSKSMQPKVVFFGDSLTEAWGMTDAWKENFEALPSLNCGIGGDRTHHLLYRIKNGELEHCKPQVIVVMIGINNIWGGYDAAETADGVVAVVEAIQELAPQSHLIFMPVLPINDHGNSDRKWVAEVNSKSLERIKDHKNLEVLDLSNDFLNADGSLKSEFYTDDKVHFQNAAYSFIASKLKPLVDAKLNQ